RSERRRTILAGATEEGEGAGEIFDGQSRLLGETVRGQIIRVTTRRGLADFDEAFLDAALQIGIDQPKRDAEIGCKLTLRLRAIAFDRFQKAEHDTGVFGFFAARSLRHPPTPSGVTSTLFTV